ncbi:hypothetical protein I315_02180 [Cryptococcus gattii Ru294]|uniref:Uncharacterized protein n=2 Tax=Cryptococcus gattii TaxID=37769 RepID=E6R3E0_CRYGW|nr:Hypothetical Protein CGB_C4245C [Cryptococcus gattii WM276]KIR55591.1 hypothetical protein I315_02180 [Cryptococcus gattii Ru294]KIR82080.1 hypothetical protein I306_00825 [Cryptococcus gattii EJB2]KIY31180.1 hypothetical protein I305_06469 [Cryptococcus gattii E566]KJD99854.1 hypothetical protein I311_06563 [Cryptococcus gattii NT-10]ADV21043.1 Hypothetical Protein CGB_C4245C [Cryptococcus gattii WM276]
MHQYRLLNLLKLPSLTISRLGNHEREIEEEKPEKEY